NSATYDQDSVARLFSAASFGDNFNRADSSSLGDNFIKIRQADNLVSISANQWSMPNSTLDLAVYSGMFAADVSVQADVALDAVNSSRAGLIARYTGVGDANMYLAQIVGTRSNAVAFIYRNVGGVWTQLATA